MASVDSASGCGGASFYMTSGYGESTTFPYNGGKSSLISWFT